MSKFLIDTHSHIYDIPGIEQLIPQLISQNIIVMGVGEEKVSNQKIREISSSYPHLIFPCFGLHPFLLSRLDIREELEWLEKHLPEAVALGEVGLDKKGETDLKFQREVLKEVLCLASRFNKPVLLHSRKAGKEIVGLIKGLGWHKVVLHWFTEPPLVEEMVEFGAYFSVTPAVVYSHTHRKVIERVPLERLLLETDSPVPFKGRVTTPLDILIPARELSKIKKKSLEEVIEVTTSNAIHLFSLSIQK